MITFYHTADIHFGVENYGKIDPQTGIHSRLLDFKKSLDLCIDQALAEGIDFFLFSGDAYKTAHPTPTQQKLLMSCLFRLQQANIPIVIVVGNHDHPMSFGRAHALDVFADLPLDGLHVIARPRILLLQTASGPVQIAGIPWPTRHNLITQDAHRFKTAKEITAHLSERVGQIISSFAAELDPTIPAVLAGHLTVSNGVFSGSEKCAIFGSDPVLLPSQLAIAPFDYVALGHLHRHQNVNPNGIPVVYAGSIDRIDFGERKEEKGFCRVTIDPQSTSRRCSYSFEPIPTRQFIQIDLVLDSTSSQTEQLLAAIKNYPIDQAIVKITYKLPPGCTDKVDLTAVHRALATAAFVASVVPIHTPTTKERRAALKIDMDIATLLDNYFATKQLDPQKKEHLLEMAQEIVAETDNEQPVEESTTPRTTGIGVQPGDV